MFATLHKCTKGYTQRQQHGFRVLQFWFQIFANLCHQLDYKIIVNILMVCVVLHKMILEDDHDE